MVGSGFALLGLALYALFMVMGDMVTLRPRGLKLFLWAMALPYLANTFGWLMTELGRAPWVVYGLMRIENAVSPTVSGGMVLTSLLVFTLIYGTLMVADVYLLRKYARAGAPTEIPGEPEEQLPSMVGAAD
jgi:cytochrome d ubiquinol oxidase subunit I